MTSELIDHSHALVAAMHEVFHDSEPCRCHGDGKLSASEVLGALARLHHVRLERVDDPTCLPIGYRGPFAHRAAWELERCGVKYLAQLTAWTYEDLLRVANLGPLGAAKIEQEMATYGLALKGADPRRLEEFDEEEPDDRPIEGTPTEVRDAVAKGLIDLGQRLLRQGGALMKYAMRASSGDKVTAGLRNSNRGGFRARRDGLRLAAALADLESREATPRRLPARVARRRAAGEITQRGTVVTGAFARTAGMVT